MIRYGLGTLQKTDIEGLTRCKILLHNEVVGLEMSIMPVTLHLQGPFFTTMLLFSTRQAHLFDEWDAERMGTRGTFWKGCHGMALLCTGILMPQIVCRPDPQRVVCCVLTALAPGEQSRGLLGGLDHGNPCLAACIARNTLQPETDTCQRLCS